MTIFAHLSEPLTVLPMTHNSENTIPNTVVARAMGERHREEHTAASARKPEAAPGASGRGRCRRHRGRHGRGPSSTPSSSAAAAATSHGTPRPDRDVSKRMDMHGRVLRVWLHARMLPGGESVPEVLRGPGPGRQRSARSRQGPRRTHPAGWGDGGVPGAVRRAQLRRGRPWPWPRRRRRRRGWLRRRW